MGTITIALRTLWPFIISLAEHWAAVRAKQLSAPVKQPERLTMSTTVAATAAHLTTLNTALQAATTVAAAAGTTPSATTLAQGAVTLACALDPEINALAVPAMTLIQEIMGLWDFFKGKAPTPAVVPVAQEPAAPVYGPTGA